MTSIALPHKVLTTITMVLLCALAGFTVMKVSMLFFVALLGILLIALLMFVWPEVGTLFVIFYIYANLAVVAKEFHGVPPLFAAAIPLLLCVPLAHALVLRQETLIIDRTFGRMLAFLLVLLVSSLCAKDIYIARDVIGNFVLEGLLIYLLVVNVIRRLETLRRVLWVLVLTGSLLGALSLHQALTRSYEQRYGGLAMMSLTPQASARPTPSMPVAERYAQRAEGSVGEPNRYAQVLLVLIPFALFLGRIERTWWLRAGAMATGFFIFWGILLSFSRGGFVTLALLLLLALVLRLLRPVCLLLAVPVLLLLIALVAPQYFARVGSIAGARGLYSEAASTEPDGATRGRATEMLAALFAFLDHPFLGVGPGQYTPFYSVQYQLDPDIAFRHVPVKRRAHNLYLEMAAETGLVGLGVFMAIVLSLLTRLWQARRAWLATHPGLAQLATACWLSILAYLTAGLFLHLSYQRYYWLLLALSGATLRLLRLPVAPEAPLGKTPTGLPHIAPPTMSTPVETLSAATGRIEAP